MGLAPEKLLGVWDLFVIETDESGSAAKERVKSFGSDEINGAFVFREIDGDRTHLLEICMADDGTQVCLFGRMGKLMHGQAMFGGIYKDCNAGSYCFTAPTPQEGYGSVDKFSGCYMEGFSLVNTQKWYEFVRKA